MAAGPITQIADVIVPSIFTSYVQQETETKSRLIASGAVARDSAIDALANPNVSVTGWGGPYTSDSTNGVLSYTVVPAPGAVALLGLAGLMARRRRR